MLDLRRLTRSGTFASIALALALGGCGGGQSQSGDGPEPTLEKQFVRTVDAVAPDVVQIETGRGLGSGVILDDDGHIVTNAHVVGSAKHFRVTFADGSREPATLVGAFRPDDLAVVSVAHKHGKAARFADSTKVEVGDIVLAVGNPLGLRSSVTNGIVSAVGRTVSEPGGVAIPGMIQTSAAINPGNSGGALVALGGEVIGIPTLAAVDRELGGAAPGIGFAIPSNTVKDIAGQIVQHGRVVRSGRAYLGVRAASTTTATGALVAAVVRGGPADEAGIRPGDLITAIAGHRIRTAAELAATLAKLKPGQHAEVQLVRPGGRRLAVDVTLAAYPSGRP